MEQCMRKTDQIRIQTLADSYFSHYLHIYHYFNSELSQHDYCAFYFMLRHHRAYIIHCAKCISISNLFFTSIVFFLRITCTGVVVDLISIEPHLWVLSFSFYDAQLLLRCVCPSAACFCLELSREKRLMVLLLMVSHLLWKQFNAWTSKALLKYWDNNCENEQLHKMT